MESPLTVPLASRAARGSPLTMARKLLIDVTTEPLLPLSEQSPPAAYEAYLHAVLADGSY